MLTLIVSALLVFAFMQPTIVIHESGHWIACDGLGFEPSPINFDLNEYMLSGKVTCHGIEQKQNLLIFWVSGGLLSGIVFTSLLIIPHVRRNTWILAPIIAIICKEFSTAFIETFYHTWYIIDNNYATSLTTVILGIAFLIIWRSSIKKQKNNVDINV